MDRRRPKTSRNLCPKAPLKCCRKAGTATATPTPPANNLFQLAAGGEKNWNRVGGGDLEAACRAVDNRHALFVAPPPRRPSPGRPFISPPRLTPLFHPSPLLAAIEDVDSYRMK